MIGRPTLIDDDERLHSLATRTIHAEFPSKVLADQFAGRTTDEWLAAFKEADIPACLVNSVDDLFDDPHLRRSTFLRRRASDRRHVVGRATVDAMLEDAA